MTPLILILALLMGGCEPARVERPAFDIKQEKLESDMETVRRQAEQIGRNGIRLKYLEADLAAREAEQEKIERSLRAQIAEVTKEIAKLIRTEKEKAAQEKWAPTQAQKDGNILFYSANFGCFPKENCQ